MESERKSERVMTVRVGRFSRNPEEACNTQLFFDDAAVRGTTLISEFNMNLVSKWAFSECAYCDASHYNPKCTMSCHFVTANRGQQVVISCIEKANRHLRVTINSSILFPQAPSISAACVPSWASTPSATTPPPTSIAGAYTK